MISSLEPNDLTANLVSKRLLVAFGALEFELLNNLLKYLVSLHSLLFPQVPPRHGPV